MLFSAHVLLLAVLGTAVTWEHTFPWLGGASAFGAFQVASGKDQMLKIYTTCVEKENHDLVKSTSVECVGRLVNYLFEAVTITLLGGYGIGTVESGVLGAQETDVPPPSKRDDKVDLSSLEAINIHLTDISTPDIHLLATDVVKSSIPSFDGVAIRFNVHGDDSTLHVHTNGSHAIATFDEGIYLGRRDILPTDGHYFEFSGVNGLKMQAHAINKPRTSDYHKDLSTFAEHFAISNVQPHPILQGSDSWDIQVCNTARTATFFYGKIVAEMNRPGKDFEPMDPPGC